MDRIESIGSYKVRLVDYSDGKGSFFCLDIFKSGEYSIDTWIEMLVSKKDVEILIEFLQNCLLTG